MVLLFIFYYLQAKQTLTLANWSWKLETSSYIRFLGGGLRLLFSISECSFSSSGAMVLSLVSSYFPSLIFVDAWLCYGMGPPCASIFSRSVCGAKKLICTE
ncbi:hypothetical protein VPH35_099022 [Triticum aestivum]|uniref:Uncharacterized protein n=1 Tax=Aegilops tauschii subsp. strangulata TaxID=200361 RepID=A0A453LEQ1_AEGTS